MSSVTELSWVAKSDKDISLPEIVFSTKGVDFEGKRCAGCFYRPQQGEFAFDGLYVPFERGVIVVSTELPEEIPSIIAHEWRHCWQFHRGQIPKKIEYNPEDFTNPDTYDSAIRKYFCTQPHEMDALLYEHKKHPTENSHRHMEAVFGMQRDKEADRELYLAYGVRRQRNWVRCSRCGVKASHVDSQRVCHWCHCRAKKKEMQGR